MSRGWSRKPTLQYREKARFSVETIWHRKDGALVPVALSGTPLQMNGSTVLHLVARDMTEHNRLERERRYSEARLNLVATSLPVVFYTRTDRASASPGG